MYYELADELMNLIFSKKQVIYERKMSQLTKSKMLILTYLCSHNYKAHPKELSEKFFLSSARVAVLLNHLEKDGLILRIPDSNDNRKTIIKISDKGRALIMQIREKYLAFFANALEQLGEEDAREYIRLNKKLLQIVSE